MYIVQGKIAYAGRECKYCLEQKETLKTLLISFYFSHSTFSLPLLAIDVLNYVFIVLFYFIRISILSFIFTML